MSGTVGASTGHARQPQPGDPDYLQDPQWCSPCGMYYPEIKFNGPTVDHCLGCVIVSCYDKRDRSEREHDMRRMPVIMELEEKHEYLQKHINDLEKQINELKAFNEALRSVLAVATPSTST